MKCYICDEKNCPIEVTLISEFHDSNDNIGKYLYKDDKIKISQIKHGKTPREALVNTRTHLEKLKRKLETDITEIDKNIIDIDISSSEAGGEK